MIQTVECVAFQKCYETMLTSIQYGIQNIYDKAFSQFLIPEEMMKDTSTSEIDKTRKLLELILNKMRQKKEIFHQFLSILRDDGTNDEIVTKLTQTLQEVEEEENKSRANYIRPASRPHPQSAGSETIAGDRSADVSISLSQVKDLLHSSSSSSNSMTYFFNSTAPGGVASPSKLTLTPPPTPTRKPPETR